MRCVKFIRCPIWFRSLLTKVFHSSSSEDDEYSDPLEVAASAGARLSRKSHYQVCFVRIQSRGYLNRKPIQRIRFL